MKIPFRVLMLAQFKRKFLHFRLVYCFFPPFGLNVHQFKTEFIFVNDTVNPAIIAARYGFNVLRRTLRNPFEPID